MFSESFSPAYFACALGVLASAGPSRQSCTRISMRTSWKTARGKYACSPLWTGSKTTCRSSSIRVPQHQRPLSRSLHLRGHRKGSADCGFTATTSTTRRRGRTSWSGPRSWACQDLACLGSRASCVLKVIILPARSSGPGNVSVVIFCSFCHSQKPAEVAGSLFFQTLFRPHFTE